MDKLVKKVVLTVYISQFALIIVAVFCCSVPLFSDSQYLTGWKAISGLCILASIFVVNIFYMTTQFQGKKSLLPGKIALECMGEMFFRIDENCNKGLFSKEDTENCKQRYNNVLKWLGRFNSLAVPLMIIDSAAIGLSIIGIVILQIKKHEVSFSSLYGVAGFFIVMQTTCLFISSRFLWKTVFAWIERLRNIKVVKLHSSLITKTGGMDGVLNENLLG